MLNLNNNSGLTLVELLISVAILGIIMVGLHQALGTAFSAYDNTKSKQELLAQVRYAMERMVMFVQESDSISMPDSASDQETLKVSERVLNTYDNAAHEYEIDGDGFLDADNDSDSLINEDDTDPPDLITFDLDKADENNWKLMEQMPDYSTASLSDYTDKQMICEHVTVFKCNLLASNLVEIELVLNNGKSEVTLKTRVKARFVE